MSRWKAAHILLVATQKSAAKDDPTPEDLYETGCVATVPQMLKLPDGTVKVLVEGLHRALLTALTNNGEFFPEKPVLWVPPRTERPKWKRCAVRCLPISTSLSN